MTNSINKKFLTAGVAILLGTAALTAQNNVSVVDRPLTGTSSNYTNFRAPLQQAPLLKLPVGTVQPKGWLRKYLELQKYKSSHSHLAQYHKPHGQKYY